MDEPHQGRREDDGAGRPPVATALGVIAALLFATGLVLLIDPLRQAAIDAIHGDTGKVRGDLHDLGAGGVALVLGLAVVHSVILYPTEILNLAAGYVYGFWAALPLMMFGWLLNGWLCWAVGRSAARPLLARAFGAERLAAYERGVERGGVTLLLATRIIPIIPFSLFSYAAGSARVPFGRFTWTTLVGYLPLTALSVYFGSQLEDFSATDPVLIGGFAGLIVLILVARRVVRREETTEPNDG
jgi:uncharacterized membrane protein YdjX (TVP38/TMEM64 family)